MMKVLIVIMMAGMWCMQPEKASAADPVIRVLLTTTDFNSRYHQEITVSYDGKEITYTAEEVKKKFFLKPVCLLKKWLAAVKIPCASVH